MKTKWSGKKRETNGFPAIPSGSNIDFSNCAYLRVYGDSMESLLQEDDLILVDVKPCEPKDLVGQVTAITKGDTFNGSVVKILQDNDPANLFPNHESAQFWRLESLNENYEPEYVRKDRTDLQFHKVYAVWTELSTKTFVSEFLPVFPASAS